MDLKPRIFVGSTSERVEVADAVELNLADFADVVHWKHAFRAGRNFLLELAEAAKNSDFAVIIVTPDDKLQSRGQDYNAPRDNVLFELGLFIGALGVEKVFALADHTTETKILSDYAGAKTLKYDGGRRDRNLRQAVSPPCNEIKQLTSAMMQMVEPLPGAQDTRSVPLIGLQYIYPSFFEAERDILVELEMSNGPIRLFFQIASQDINARGSLFDALTEKVERSGVEIRVLHAGVDSPLFSRDRLSSLGKRPDTILRSLRHVDEALRHLEGLKSSSLRHRTHDYPFIWRMYAFSNSLYVMPYFSVRDAVTKPPVLKFYKSDNSLYHSFINWSDYTWTKFAPSHISLGDVITPATPCGTALFLTWDGFHVFGIPKRDVIEGSEYVRFYGLGGKRKDASETLEECAVREGNEESGGAIDRLISSHETSLFRFDGVIQKIVVEGSLFTPALIYQKGEHTGHGAMSSTADYYYMVGYNAMLSKKPLPSREIAAFIFLNDRHLEIVSRRNDVTIENLIEAGAQIVEQLNIKIKSQKILVPHGTASYLVRRMTR